MPFFECKPVLFSPMHRKEKGKATYGIGQKFRPSAIIKNTAWNEKADRQSHNYMPKNDRKVDNDFERMPALAHFAAMTNE